LGVLTIGALLGTAAHLDGLGATVLDFTGLAQKNGAVVSQVRIAPSATPIHAVRIGAGEIDLLLGTDAVTAASPDALSKIAIGRSALVLNDDEAPVADIVTDRDAALPMTRMIDTLLDRAGEHAHVISATRIAEGLFGSNVAANVFLVGFAWQKGLLPLSSEAFAAAIEANGAAVALNKRAFAWGRLAAVNRELVENVAGVAAPEEAPEEAIDALIERRRADLTAYQDAAYATRYGALLDDVRRAAAPLGAAGDDFVRAVALNAYKLMAYKDEYEVARLYAAPDFRRGLEAQFAGTKRLAVWLAPPFLTRTDPRTGRPAKRKFGPWIFYLFPLMARLKVLRGSALDPFGRTAERRAERQIRDEYVVTIRELCVSLDTASLEHATALATLPDEVRGYGPVKEEALRQYSEARSNLLAPTAATDPIRIAA
jgi:indolepyruvate ferredoxin oxidoreductase